MLVSAISAPVVASASETDWSAIGLVFFLSGFIFYGAMFLRYRNADKRFRHESLTRSEVANMQVRDDFVKSQKGLKNSKLRGANNRQVSGSLNSLSKFTDMGGENMQQILKQVGRFRRDG